MAITYTDLLDVDLGILGTAVSDWRKAVSQLKKLADNARTGMVAKSEAARWAGMNATVSRAFVAETAKEVADLHTEARSIHRILDDAHTDLVSLQKQIVTAVRVDAVELGLRVETIGSGEVRCFYPHIRGDSDDRTQEQLDARRELEDRINRILAHASEIDASVARALAKSHGDSAHNAGHSSYGSLDEAQAERAAELARLGPEMSDEQLTELNSLLRHNARDADFSTRFYSLLGGPQEALEFYGRMALNGTEGDDKARLLLTQQLQRHMGLALASATDPDNKSHLPASWATEFRKLGSAEIKLYPGGMSHPFGYQILGGLLRYGDYDARFLNPIAEHIVQLHQKDPYRFVENKPTSAGDADWGFNPSGKSGAGYDPLTSVLEALGHSPDAAKKFFDPEMTPTVYNEDGTVNRRDTLGYSYFEELTKKDFVWPPDSPFQPGSEGAEKARGFGPDALGHALEAATLGHAYDDPTPRLVRDETTAAIMEKVVAAYGDPENVKEPLADSLGRMGAGYIDDLNWGLNDNRPDSLFAPTGTGHAVFGIDNSIRFLSSVGQHPDAYAEISTAQQIYATTALEAQAQGGRIDQPAAREIVRTGAEIQGFLDQSRADQVAAEGVAKDEAYNKSLEEKTGWIKFGAGVAIAGGAAFLPPVAAVGVAGTLIPVFMDAGQGAITQQIANVIDDSAQTHQLESGSTIQEQKAEIYAVGQTAAESPMDKFLAAHGISRDHDRFGQDLEEAANSGYTKGTNRENQRGVLPQA
ncbi:DUF6571 family protein [Streptomyces sp. NPDC001595]|uniref:DUF6571 family protein n=1 Tax=Streptomyces sp. NPDC001532 TaxID=3154520 RepID=UPI00332023E5